MNYSLQAYIKTLPTSTLIQFLQQYNNNDLEENYSYIIPEIQKELNSRET